MGGMYENRCDPDILDNGYSKSVMEVLFKTEGGAAAVITPLAAVAMLVFCLLYTPCVAAIAAIRRELGRSWAAGIVVWQCVLAWMFSFLVYLIGGLFIR